MSRNTLARAYAAKTSRPSLASGGQALPASTETVQPAAAAGPTTRGTATGGVQAREALIEDALLIAVRRSLASCRDSSQRRMLAAFEARR